MVKHKFVPLPLPHRPGESSQRPIEIKPVVRYHRHETAWRILQLVWFALSLFWARRVRRRSNAELAARVRNFLEHMGGLFIKAGQVLSLRSDLLSKEMVDELARLQSRAHGFSPALARQIIEDTIGRRLEDVFDHYEEMPFAAASISQEHRARLRMAQIRVVLKVQRPNMNEIFERDLAIISWLVRSFALVSTLMARLNPEAFLTELRQVLREELDFRYEAGNLIAMRKKLRKHGIFVPKLFWRYSGQRLIVMEELTGTLMSDYLEAERADPIALRAWCAANEIKPRRVGSRLLRSYYRQLFEDNLFHGDLHPGNIMLFRKSRIGLLDLGSVGSLDIHFIRVYREMTAAIGQRDYYKAIDYYLQLSDSVPVIDVTALRAELIQVFRDWESRTRVPGLTYLEKSASGALMGEIQKIEAKYGVTKSWQLLRVGRASVTLDSNLAALLGDADPGDLLRKYFRQAQARAWKALRKKLVPNVMGAAGQVAEMMRGASSMLRKASIDFQGVRNLGGYLATLFATAVYRAGWIVAAIAVALVISPEDVDAFVAAHPVLDIIASPIHSVAELGRIGGGVLLVSAAVFIKVIGTMRSRIAQTNVRLPSGDLAG